MSKAVLSLLKDSKKQTLAFLLTWGIRLSGPDERDAASRWNHFSDDAKKKVINETGFEHECTILLVSKNFH